MTLRNLTRAAEVFATLDTLELRGTDRGRVDTEKRRFFQRIYDDARGNAPANPANAADYERGIIGLINLERTGPLLDEYNEYLIMQARAALGASPELALDSRAASSVAAASAEQAAASIVFLDRLINGDERAQVRTPPEGSMALEANALRTALQLKLFEAEFDARWSTRFRDAFAQAGRYDAASNRFTIRYSGPFREGLSAADPPDVLLHQAQTWHAREIATDLAYELAGVARDGADPLPFRVTEFATATATEVTTDEAGNFTFLLGLPYATVQKGGYLLEERLRAPAPVVAAAGSGDPANEGSE